MAGSATATEIDEAMTRHTGRLMVAGLSQGQLVMGTRHTPAGSVQYPLVRTGAFARVFSMTDVRGAKRAVRCFYSAPQPQYQQRYTVIDQFFRQKLPKVTADFHFHEQGIRIRVKPPELTMPIMDMEWVEGETLLSQVDKLALKGDSAGLRRLSNAWAGLVRQMRSVGMAHGDLSGENVMVRHADSSLVVIDYDSIFLPQFAGQTTDQAGNPAYQHPDLQNRPYDATMDNFSALLIYVALFALSEQPQIWKHHSMHDAAGNLQIDTLLFRVDDLRDPGKSSLFSELSRINNPEFQKMLQALRVACLGPVNNVPDVITTTQLKCPSCGTANPATKVLCSKCGKALTGPVTTSGSTQTRPQSQILQPKSPGITGPLSPGSTKAQVLKPRPGASTGPTPSPPTPPYPSSVTTSVGIVQPSTPVPSRATQPLTAQPTTASHLVAAQTPGTSPQFSPQGYQPPPQMYQPPPFSPVYQPPPFPYPTAGIQPQHATAKAQVGGGFWFLWILASCAGVALGQAGGFQATTTAADIANINIYESYIGLVTLFSFTFWLVLAFAQWLVLLRVVRRAGWWLLATPVLGAISDAAGYLITGTYLGPGTLAYINLAFYSVLVGTAQWLVLRGQVKAAGWWLPVSAIAWGGSQFLGLYVERFINERETFVQSIQMYLLVSGAVAGAVYGLVTGTALVLLMRHPRKVGP